MHTSVGSRGQHGHAADNLQRTALGATCSREFLVGKNLRGSAMFLGSIVNGEYDVDFSSPFFPAGRLIGFLPGKEG
jgi:hypothetical protein